MDILVVDDTPGVADIVAQMLEMHGHRAHMASTLEQAWQAIGQGSYEACIVDLGIEDEEGRFIGLLRARGVRAIAWTASEDRWRASPRAALYDFFFAKPASFDTILAAVEGRACSACGQPIGPATNHADCAWARR